MIETLFKAKTNNTFIQLFRYTFVGGIAFIVDFGLLFILTEYFGLYYLLSASLSFLFGLATNYLLSVAWVFQNRSLESKSTEFFIFGMIGLAGLILNALIIYFFTEIVGTHYLLSKIISTILVYLWNFFVRKYTLFK